MADHTPYEQIQDLRYTLIDHITHVWLHTPPDKAEQVTKRLLGPVGAPAAKELAGAMYEAVLDPDGSLDPAIEQAVAALLAVVGTAVRAEVHHVVDASLKRLGIAPSTPARDTPVRVYMEDGRPIAWVDDPLPGGVVCAVADPAKRHGLCGMPVESESCSIHYPGAGDE
jgi:hypothetical protein